MKAKEILGKNVRHFRLEHKYSQERLAELGDISARYISRIENCKDNVSLDIIDKLAKNLGIDVYELFLKRNVYNVKKRVNMK